MINAYKQKKLPWERKLFNIMLSGQRLPVKEIIDVIVMHNFLFEHVRSCFR